MQRLTRGRRPGPRRLARARVRRIHADAGAPGRGGDPLRLRLGERRAALSHEGPPEELHALPITLPLDDVNALWDRRIAGTFETLYREGLTTGRLLGCTCTRG